LKYNKPHTKKINNNLTTPYLCLVLTSQPDCSCIAKNRQKHPREEMIMLKLSVVITAILLALPVYAQRTFKATLIGVQETPIVVSTGSGRATLTISDDEKSINYELTYSGLEGNTVPSGKVLFAHVHVGGSTVVGGVAVFFCGGGNSATTQAACPISGTLTGTWTAADVVGPTAQGIDPANQGADGAFARLVNSIKAGLSYANVHTTRSTGGEIRGQLLPAHHDHDHDDDGRR
jgi:CHRD domain